MQQEILDILEQQVINKTLNLDGIESVRKIMAESKVLASDNKNLTKQLESARSEEGKLRTELINKRADYDAINRQNAEYKKEADKVYRDSIRHEYEVKRGEELKEIVHLALRNPTITKSRFGGQDVYDNGVMNHVCSNNTEIEETT